MSNKFSEALEVILHHEGGYVNHPKDPGGMTNMGVTKRVYEEHVGYGVSEHTMQNLTKEDVEPIYKKNYWDRVKGDNLPEGLDLCIFDFAVNAGPGRAAKFLQKLIGVTQDGGIGPQTLGALQSAIGEDVRTQTREMIEKYQNERHNYYQSLSTFETFGRGWTRRVDEVTEKAKEWIA